MTDEELAQWVKTELMANQSDELTRNREKIKKFVRLTSDGSVMINDRKLTSRIQVALYYIAAAYAKAAGLRPDDSVSNHEIANKLGLPDGTVHPKVKELRDGHFIEAVKDGVHRVNYARIDKLLAEAEKREGVLS